MTFSFIGSSTAKFIKSHDLFLCRNKYAKAHEKLDKLHAKPKNGKLDQKQGFRKEVI